VFEDANKARDPSLYFRWVGGKKVVQRQNNGDLRDLRGAETCWFLEIQSQHRVYYEDKATYTLKWIWEDEFDTFAVGSIQAWRNKVLADTILGLAIGDGIEVGEEVSGGIFNPDIGQLIKIAHGHIDIRNPYEQFPRCFLGQGFTE
jgi:hypothetical protein